MELLEIIGPIVVVLWVLKVVLEALEALELLVPGRNNENDSRR